MWNRLLFDRSKLRAQVDAYAAWPLWRKCAALLGVSIPAISLVLRPWLEGRLILGSRTIIPSDEPVLFILVLVVFEAALAFMFYALIKAFFFPASIRTRPTAPPPPPAA